MMDEERQSTKPADSDVAPLTAEQMKETWEQMLSNTQNILQQNLTEENLSIPIAPFGLTPAMMMQLAMMQMPLMSLPAMQLGVEASKDSHRKADLKNNKSNNTAHSLISLDNPEQQIHPTITPLVEESMKRDIKRSRKGDGLSKPSRNKVKTKSGTTEDDEIIDDVIEEGMNEKDLKRLKRKQSNRESARRSRMRKQAECEGLMTENANLKAEIQQLRKQQKELREAVTSLKRHINDLKK